MSFESLAHRYSFRFANFPDRWLPLMQLYDPDLPLFPVMYFHRTKPVGAGARPLDQERVFGYVESVAPHDGSLEVVVVVNKRLDDPANAEYEALAREEVAQRLGLGDPVVLANVQGAFSPKLGYANAVLREIWARVVSNPYGDSLPFGRLWDEVLGFARFVASWYSQSGRKGELIQTHYFASRFGVEIQTANPIPQRDFFLLPSIAELQDPTNPLSSFPAFRDLVKGASEVASAHGFLVQCGKVTVTGFRRPKGVPKLDTAAINVIIQQDVGYGRQAAVREAFNAFGKGPSRTIIGLLLLHDIRTGNLRPAALDASDMGALYSGLSGTYQSPKVLAIYAQQCYANAAAMPIDMWVKTFLRYPLRIWQKKEDYTALFGNAANLGKVERLIWVTAQARKVHSRACDDAVWCIKLGGGADKAERGANPLACTVCLPAIRDACPAFDAIRNSSVSVNGTSADADFDVTSSAGRFTGCRGRSAAGPIIDVFTPDDSPAGLAPYPQHTTPAISVAEFVALYRAGG